jgi:hypothetical protein
MPGQNGWDVASMLGVCVGGLWVGNRVAAVPKSGIDHSTHSQHHLVVVIIPISSKRCSTASTGGFKCSATCRRPSRVTAASALLVHCTAFLRPNLGDLALSTKRDTTVKRATATPIQRLYQRNQVDEAHLHITKDVVAAHTRNQLSLRSSVLKRPAQFGACAGYHTAHNDTYYVFEAFPSLPRHALTSA